MRIRTFKYHPITDFAITSYYTPSYNDIFKTSKNDYNIINFLRSLRKDNEILHKRWSFHRETMVLCCSNDGCLHPHTIIVS